MIKDIIMNTRSASMKFELEYDFDEASEVWRKNKKALPNGMYKYICIEKTGTCKRKPLLSCNLCAFHTKLKDENCNMQK
jgi:hypothetical protein